MRTKFSITKKWEYKIEEMKKKADFKYSVLLENSKRRFDKKYEYELAKIERKKSSYIKKKEEDYRKKMMNELRVLE